jgi:hypothetical protein
MAWRSRGVDRWEVWICDVPPDAVSAVYAPSPRVPLVAEQVARVVQRRVAAYFSTVSNGRYTPEFRSGGAVALAPDGEPAGCVEQALRGSSDEAQGVLVVATAEHVAEQPGTWSNGGAGCATPCAASVSRRHVYVGAADFAAVWGTDPPMDLIEHELGHALGWWHSAYAGTLAQPYRSAVDLLSNSAAPRDTLGARRDGPTPIAAHLLQAGWIVADAAPTVDLTRRVAVAEVDDHRFLMVELRRAVGFDDHLPQSGAAVHLIDVSARTITPVHTTAEPFDDLLQPGESASVEGLTVRIAEGWGVTVER